MIKEVASSEGIVMHPVSMSRSITPLRDLLALGRLVKLFIYLRPDIVHSHTPKGGLLGTLGACIAGVPVRCYTLHGLPMMTGGAVKRQLLKWSETLACACAHRVFCVSDSIRKVSIRLGICPKDKIQVLCNRSSNGVDGRTFQRTGLVQKWARELRANMNIPEDALVMGFVGRLVRDKGIWELVSSWRILRREFQNLHLLVIGSAEAQDPLSPEILDLLGKDERIHRVEWVPKKKMPGHYAAMNIVVLPSYREGFPNVLLEAAAMALPVAATRIPGCLDAVVDGLTGILVPPRDAAGLAHAVHRLLEDPGLRWRMGEAGRQRALRDFRPEPIWLALCQEYWSLLRRKCSRDSLRRLLDRVYQVARSRDVPCTRFSSVGKELQARPGRQMELLKRAVDFSVALVGIVALLPLFLLVALLIRLTIGGPIFYVSERPGIEGRIFRLYKFRTMRYERGPHGELPPDSERLTALGRFIRRWSLDELP
jgi:glycosyltransferase involved in cell wall biosynthesis